MTSFVWMQAVKRRYEVFGRISIIGTRAGGATGEAIDQTLKRSQPVTNEIWADTI